MKLNNLSYLHLKIRKLCQFLCYYSDMNLMTNLDDEFEQLYFANKLSYIIINYKRKACLTMSHKITKQEWEIIDELILYLSWLETGNRIKSKHK